LKRRRDGNCANKGRGKHCLENSASTRGHLAFPTGEPVPVICRVLKGDVSHLRTTGMMPRHEDRYEKTVQMHKNSLNNFSFHSSSGLHFAHLTRNVISKYIKLYHYSQSSSLNMKNAVFWDVAPCRSCVNRPFGGTYRLHLQGRKFRERGTIVSRWLQTY
jgi:hypothetical protein